VPEGRQGEPPPLDEQPRFLGARSSTVPIKRTSASRCHHLLKTFWGWRDKQLPDATVIWTLPSGQMYVTTPGSALLFPTLCAPTAELPPPDPKPADRTGDRTVMMPRRNATRAESRARYVAAERARNRKLREARNRPKWLDIWDSASRPPNPDEEPPPF
jgi:hypothetical protein